MRALISPFTELTLSLTLPDFKPWRTRYESVDYGIKTSILTIQRNDGHTFLFKFWHFQMTVSQWKLTWLTPNLGILQISVCSFRLCGSIVAYPIINRLVPSFSQFEIKQWQSLDTRGLLRHMIWLDANSKLVYLPENIHQCQL